MPGQRRLGYLSLVISALLFGAATPLAVYALRALTPFDLLAIEIGSATAALWVVLALFGQRKTSRWSIYALLGFLDPALSYVLYNLGLARTSASHGALLESLDGLFVVTLGVVLLRERLRTGIVVSLALGLAGAALVSMAEGADGPDRATRAGDGLVVLGIVAAAFYSIGVRRFGGREPALTITAHQFLAATVLLTPVVLATWLLHGSGLPRAAPSYLAAALGSGLLGTAGAYFLFNIGIAQVPAGRAVLVLNLIPVFGTLAAVIGLGEQLRTVEVAGGALIVLGLFALSLAGGEERGVETAPAGGGRAAPLAASESGSAGASDTAGDAGPGQG